MTDLDSQIDAAIAHLAKLRKAKRDLKRAKMTDRQERAKAVYVANQIPVSAVAVRFGTSKGAINRWARKFNWPRRSPPKCNAQTVRWLTAAD